MKGVDPRMAPAIASCGAAGTAVMTWRDAKPLWMIAAVSVAVAFALYAIFRRSA